MRVKLMDGTIKEMTRNELAESLRNELDKIKMNNIKKELMKRFYTNCSHDYIDFSLYGINDIEKFITSSSRKPERFTAVNFRRAVKEIATKIFGEKESSKSKYDCKTFDKFLENFTENKIFYKLVYEYFLHSASLFCDEPYVDSFGEEWYLFANDLIKEIKF